MEAIDGRDVGEDARGDLRRDAGFCQLGAENLGVQRPVEWVLSWGEGLLFS